MPAMPAAMLNRSAPGRSAAETRWCCQIRRSARWRRARCRPSRSPTRRHRQPARSPRWMPRVGANTAHATATCCGKPMSTPARRIVAWYASGGLLSLPRNVQPSSVTEPTMKLVVEPRHSSTPTSTRLPCATTCVADATSPAVNATVVKQIMKCPPPKGRELTASRKRRKGERLGSGFVVYFRLPQKRWMRRQASSRSSVLVA